ncbi:S8 family serine peptidase [uncultured Flavobacterium sp.]|uniref:S8 family serine peptidase n=2 Tax=uncultured Flavobacterium sp. TaxID=165435 RepID=UPI0025DB67E2|nr:S8 family serine peptidase [uncultured Flavobacterium sp.]
MRNWHHNLIQLDQALVLINAKIAADAAAEIAAQKPVTPPFIPTIGVADSGYIEFEGLTTPVNGLNYKALNEGLKKNLGSVEKASLIRKDPTNFIAESSAITNILNNTTSSHGISCAGIILGNKDNESGVLLPIKGITEDAKLMSFSSSIEDCLLGSIDGGKIDRFVKTASVLSTEYKNLIYNLKSSTDQYVPSQKECNIISASVAFQKGKADENQLKVFFNVLKTYGNKGRGTIFIASAGNDYGIDTTNVQGYSLNDYPIIVSASTLDANNNEVVAPYSSDGDRLDLCAPSNNHLDPAKNLSIELGMYSTTRLYSGDLGTDNEVITKQITNQTAADSLTLADVDCLYPGNCVELGNPDTNNHEIMVIEKVDRLLNKIYFSKPRTKTLSPYVLAPTPASGSQPARDAFRVPILKTDMNLEGASRNFIRVANNKGFGYVGQEVCIIDTSVQPGTNPPRKKYFYTTITGVNPSNLFEIRQSIPAINTGPWEAIPGQIIAHTKPPHKVSGGNTIFTFDNSTNISVFDSFFKDGMVEVVDTTNITQPVVRQTMHINSINKASKTITLAKYNEQDSMVPLSLRSIGYGSYTSRFGGTSAAAPVVSGVVGLLLKANPNLNAIEIKHILKTTADKITGINNYSSVTNDSKYNYGYSVNNKFGAGRINATNAVQLAIDWQTSTTLQKPKLAIADRDINGVLDGVALTDPVDSPDIWLNSETPPSAGQNFNELDTSKSQKIYVRVRNQGDRESFKGYDLRVLAAFTDDLAPAFPFPEKWCEQEDVRIIAIKEIDPIPANSEKIIKIDLKRIADIWNEWNPEINGKRKNAYLLAHIAPFDGKSEELSLTNIRSNKQLTCKPIIVKYNGIKNKVAYVNGTTLNITVDSGIVDKSYDLIMENVLTTDLTTFKLKATKTKKNTVTGETFYKKTSAGWGIENGIAVDWITFHPAIESPGKDLNHTNVKFPHTIKVNNKDTEVKLEIVII